MGGTSRVAAGPSPAAKTWSKSAVQRCTRDSVPTARCSAQPRSRSAPGSRLDHQHVERPTGHGGFRVKPLRRTEAPRAVAYATAAGRTLVRYWTGPAMAAASNKQQGRSYPRRHGAPGIPRPRCYGQEGRSAGGTSTGREVASHRWNSRAGPVVLLAPWINTSSPGR